MATEVNQNMHCLLALQYISHPTEELSVRMPKNEGETEDGPLSRLYCTPLAVEAFLDTTGFWHLLGSPGKEGRAIF
jgi:hypothetical protein